MSNQPEQSAQLPMWVPQLGVRAGRGRSRRRGDLSVTDRVSREQLTLPLWSEMDDAVLDRVAAGIRAFFGGRCGDGAPRPWQR